MAAFKYDKNTGREWVEIDLRPGSPVSRARIQTYAREMNRTIGDWVFDAIVWFMQECDRQMESERKYRTDTATRVRRPPWMVKIADTLYGLADNLSGASEADE